MRIYLSVEERVISERIGTKEQKDKRTKGHPFRK